MKKYILIIAGLLLIVLAGTAYFAYTGSVKNRPTLMYFRADL
jgi:hypothetical protein